MNKENKKQLACLAQNEKELDELYHDYASGYGLSDTAFWLLYFIWDIGDSCTQTDICEKWFYKRQSINSALKKLELQGYLTLEAIPGNKKSKHIVLTTSGKALADKVMSPLVTAELDALATFDNQELDMFVKLEQKRTLAFRHHMMKIMPNNHILDKK